VHDVKKMYSGTMDPGFLEGLQDDHFRALGEIDGAKYQVGAGSHVFSLAIYSSFS
jgi:hypothetical protein